METTGRNRNRKTGISNIEISTAGTRTTGSSKIAIGKFAVAIGLAIGICGTAIGSAFAGGGHDGTRHHEAHHGHDRGHERGPVYVAPNYYAPPPNYYYAPEPEYYPAEPVYSAPAPSEGINLFFGIR